LTKESWLSIAEPAFNKPKEEYLLTYFLGSIPNEIKQKINYYAKKYNLKVVDLGQPKIRKYYLTDPAEFLNYINTASLFFTDSFHGTVFSILFGTPFITTDRKGSLPSMNSRIRTLLKTYRLEKRHILDMNEAELFNISFDHIEKILKLERQKALNYLTNALKSN